MSVNVLLGVGGTGAKVVEAALYMALAGLGPRRLIVGLIDQDNNNGNVIRTEELVKRLGDLRRQFGPGRNQLDWEADEGEGGVVLGRTEVLPLFDEEGECQWRPSADSEGDLTMILNKAKLDADRRALMDVLFIDDEHEQRMPLDQGYRGRAHLGAACMLASLETENDFKDRVAKLMRDETADQDVRIFLAGSVFGGTGAAGFPTLARWIDQQRRDAERFTNGEKVRLGGALMLPYFGFDPPDAESTDRNVVEKGDLMPQARSALEYYDGLFKTDAVFDRVYIAGWDNFFHLKYHSPGDTDQRNPPLPPELWGGQAALDFFGAEFEEGLPTEVDVRVSAREQVQALTWADVPPLARPTGLHERLGGLIRFAAYWTYKVEPQLETRANGGAGETWIRDLTDGVDFRTGTPEARKTLAALMRDVLTWAASLQLFASSLEGDAKLNFKLWDVEALRDSGDKADPTQPVTIRGAVGDLDLTRIYDRMLIAMPKQKHPATAEDLWTAITRNGLKPAAGKTKGLGRAVALVHEAAIAEVGAA